MTAPRHLSDARNDPDAQSPDILSLPLPDRDSSNLRYKTTSQPDIVLSTIATQ